MTRQSHLLHAGDRDWPVSNCYTDMWIELLHWLRLDPVPGLAFTLATTFDGEQWSLHKYPAADLYLLYGLNVEEINVWRPLREHVEHHLAHGRPVLTEVDSYYLPDTSGTTYRTHHEKTTIAIIAIDAKGPAITYLHDAGQYTLEGTDFRGALGELSLSDSTHLTSWSLPPYVEIARLDRVSRLADADLAARAMLLARMALSRRPAENPFVAFRSAFGHALDWMGEGGSEAFHQYAFAAIRQPGSAFQYGSEFLQWLDKRTDLNLVGPAEHLKHLSAALKTLMLKTARSVAARRSLNFNDPLETMATHWDKAMEELVAEIGDDPLATCSCVSAGRRQGRR